MTSSGAAESSPQPAVDGVVLAAGAARRMGKPKATLVLEGRTFMERVTDTLRNGGCRNILVVARPGDEATGRAANVAGARVVMNTDEDAQQIDSLRLALRNVDAGVRAIVLMPVDHPLVRAATVRAVISTWQERDAPIVRTLYRGRPGHPTLFARAMFDSLLGDDLPDGAESLIQASRADVVDVEVDDAGIVADIDTPEDLQRHVRGGAA